MRLPLCLATFSFARIASTTHRIGILLMGALLGLATGCSSSFDDEAYEVETIGTTSGSLLDRSRSSTQTDGVEEARGPLLDEAELDTPVLDEQQRSILENILSLVDRAELEPGGDNFNIARGNLNDLFGTMPKRQFQLTEATRTLLRDDPVISDLQVEDLERIEYGTFDTRYVEDMRLLSRVARRLVDPNDPKLDQVRDLFAWMVRQVQPIPSEIFSYSNVDGTEFVQAQARPFDVTLRGMATEDGTLNRAERSWLFLTLCRQIGVDAGIVRVTPKSATRPDRDELATLYQASNPAIAMQALEEDPGRILACAVLIDGRAYLFDTRLGLEMPAPDGQGVATLRQALEDPRVLAQLAIPGQESLVTYDQLRDARIDILLDSASGTLTPRMRLFQRTLTGDARMVLYRNVDELAEAFREALGDLITDVELWALPALVERRLLNDPGFQSQTSFVLQFFNPELGLPLLAARITQLSGQTRSAITQYVRFRFSQNLRWANDEPAPPPIVRVMDIYSTYFLGLAQLERGDLKNAERMFQSSMQITPVREAEGLPLLQFSFLLYRHGAQINLARILEETGRGPEAIAAWTHLNLEFVPEGARHTGLLRARTLIFEDPFALEVPVDAEMLLPEGPERFYSPWEFTRQARSE